jgi:hypothetical protein
MTGRGREGWGWAASRPELLITAVLVAAVSLAGYAFAGPGGAAAVLIVTAGGALFLLRGIPLWQPEPPPAEPEPAAARAPTSFNGFWRKRAGVAGATQSLSGFDLELRGTLQNLLAARLAERHGVSLYADPDAARRLLFPGGRAAELWFWVDPARPAAAAGDPRPGIKPRSLATLIDRLERL